MEPEPILSEDDEQPAPEAPRAGAVNPEAWQRVQLARHPKCPHTLDYIERLFTDFQEIHGDRLYGDDRRIVAIEAGALKLLKKGEHPLDVVAGGRALWGPGPLKPPPHPRTPGRPA